MLNSRIAAAPCGASVDARLRIMDWVRYKGGNQEGRSMVPDLGYHEDRFDDGNSSECTKTSPECNQNISNVLLRPLPVT